VNSSSSRLDKRRGLVNLGSNFEVAVCYDSRPPQLHVTLDDLKLKETVMPHLLKGQISYIKGIALNSRTNSEATANV
jgi:hypothetical protein